MSDRSLGAHLQDCISFLCITSTEFLKLIRNSLKPELLSSSVVSRVLRACFDYYDLTKEAPKDHICDALENDLRTKDTAKKELLTSYLGRISEMREPSQGYVISRLSDFIRTKELENAAVDFVKLVERQEFDKAQDLMYSVLKSGIREEILGCDYFFDFASLGKTLSEIYLMPYGIEQLDAIRQLRRKELLCILGGYKGKKSWAGHHLGRSALLRGLNVAHFSHEVDQEECEERYDRMVGSLTSYDIGTNPFDFYELDEKTGRVVKKQITRPCVLNAEARRKARRTLQRFGGRLIIRKFAMGGTDMRDIERHLDWMETHESFIPDVIINDYPEIMKPLDASKSMRDQINESYIYHKRLADERDCLMIVMSQARREAIRAKRLGMQDFAEDIRKLANVDTVIGVCQTDLQVLSNLATLYVVAARKGKMDRGCGIVQNLDCGQFCTQSFSVKVGREAIRVAGENEKSEDGEDRDSEDS